MEQNIVVRPAACGEQHFTAVGSNSFLISLLINLFIGISLGSNVVIAHYIGQRADQNVSSGIVIFILMHETEPIRLDLKKLAVDTHELKRILKIGIPAALNFEFFAYFMVNAFAQATVTFTSQNYGAGEYER